MHICCANCALSPFAELGSRGVELRGLWFNPNIHPEEEYALRLAALRQLQGLWRLEIEYVDRYGLGEYLEALDGHDGVRCEACYRMRLEETARRAKAEGFDAFSTTLLVSPYQKHELLADVGRGLQERHGVEFHYEDFRPAYREGVKMSRELGLYRQRYCGCLYSKEEREAEKAKPRAAGARGAR
ncbi:MAG: epoxyqueuosine reductase QueH [Nitrospirota bacterium]|jgi:predicted adenine nucleotide alpha hydrolase (AANH) superfamily ATPase